MAGVKPACMDEREWLVWQAANEQLRTDERAASPCRDCTPLWHKDMTDAGQCDGVPQEGQRVAMANLRTYAELKAIRSTYPMMGAPIGLREEMYRARMREYQSRRRRSAGISA